MHRCREDVEKDEDIIVDILMDNKIPAFVKEMSLDEARELGARGIYNRGNMIHSSYKTMNDVHVIMRAFPDVHFRYLLAP